MKERGAVAKSLSLRSLAYTSFAKLLMCQVTPSAAQDGQRMQRRLMRWLDQMERGLVDGAVEIGGSCRIGKKVEAGSPWAVTHPGLPQIRTGPSKASGSSIHGLAGQLPGHS